VSGYFDSRVDACCPPRLCNTFCNEADVLHLAEHKWDTGFDKVPDMPSTTPADIILETKV
jgi:hypothetical protein